MGSFRELCCTFRSACGLCWSSVTARIYYRGHPPSVSWQGATVSVTLVSEMLRGSRLLCPLALSRVFTRHLSHFGKASFPPPTWFGCEHHPVLDKRTWTGFSWQLTEVSLLWGHYCLMWLVMDFSSHQVLSRGNSPLTPLAFVIIKVLLLKLHLVS